MGTFNQKLHSGRRHQPRYHGAVAVLVIIGVIIALFCRNVKAQAEEVASIKVEAIKEVNQLESKKAEQLARENEYLKHEATELTQLASLPMQEKMARMIRYYFSDDLKTALAVFKHESGLNPNSMGWNCLYDGASKACKPQDRPKAWSVDCGLAQLNFPGTVCPKEAFDPEWNLQQARAKFERRGWQPWVAYWSDGYRQSLEWAEKLIAKI